MLAVLLVVHPLLIVVGQGRIVVVSHRHNRIQNAFFEPGIPVGIDIIVRPGGLERRAGRSRRRRVPCYGRCGLLDPRFDGLDLGVYLSHNCCHLVAPPLFPLLICINRLTRQAVVLVISSDAGRVVTLVAFSKSYIIIMNSVYIEPADHVHRRVDTVLRRQRMTRIELFVGIPSLCAGVIYSLPVVVQIGQAARGGADVLIINDAGSRSKHNHPCVNFYSLLTPRRIVSGIDYSLKRVEVGRRETGHIRLSNAGWIVYVAASPDLEYDCIAVRLAKLPFLCGADCPKQSIHLRLVQSARPPGVYPKRPKLGSV